MLTTTTLTIIGLAIWLLGYLFIGGYLQKVYLKYKPGRPPPIMSTFFSLLLIFTILLS
jgi:uncharacterized protein YneF (UPF0154 family)